MSPNNILLNKTETKQQITQSILLQIKDSSLAIKIFRQNTRIHQRMGFYDNSLINFSRAPRLFFVHYVASELDKALLSYRINHCSSSFSSVDVVYGLFCAVHSQILVV